MLSTVTVLRHPVKVIMRVSTGGGKLYGGQYYLCYSLLLSLAPAIGALVGVAVVVPVLQCLVSGVVLWYPDTEEVCIRVDFFMVVKNHPITHILH